MDKYLSINAEGCSVRCKLYYEELPAVRNVILFCHGFGGHKDNKAAESFAKRAMEKNKGLAVVTFNWPCHGDDVRKTLRLEDCSLYLKLVLAYLRERFEPEALYAYATSFGAYLLLKDLSENGNPFRKIALRSPAVPMYRVMTDSIMGEGLLATIEKGKPALVGFDRKVAVDKVFLDSLKDADLTQRDFLPFADDILILHGTADEIVPFEAVKTFAENNVLDFIPVKGADHRFLTPGAMTFANSCILASFGLK